MKRKPKDTYSSTNKAAMSTMTVGELVELVEGTNNFSLLIVPGNPPSVVVTADGKAAIGIIRMLHEFGQIDLPEINKQLEAAMKTAQA